ncbi:MAG: hypothetical protein P9X26_07620 [Candidatus Stygibacter frigidus]|nr:hypothetical protein [Candidatus Stygibacter frigidus]
MNSILLANTLKDYYHSNYGPVERVVFVFDEQPRYRLREDISSDILSCLVCGKVDAIRSIRVVDNPVITNFTFVPTDAFVGVLINTHNEYRLDTFLLKSGDDYKLVLDIFQHKEPLTPEEAREYAEFYRNVNKYGQALYFENVADSMVIENQRAEIKKLETAKQAAKQAEEEAKKLKEEAEKIPSYPVVSKPAETIEEQPVVSQPAPERISDSDNFLKANLPLSVYEVLEDIYLDKMLMFSIIVVFGVIFIMLIMSLIRKLHKTTKVKQEKPSDSFGTLEFQRVTIRRLLSNGWQIEEIAKELNITTDEVEELGRGIS